MAQFSRSCPQPQGGRGRYTGKRSMTCSYLCWASARAN